MFGDGGAIYATKAFLCRAMARLVHEEGLRLDVATGGELEVALAADVPADRLVLHGNNKSLAELRRALSVGVGRIVVDSYDELDRIGSLVADGLTPPKVLLRINPGIEVHTHEHVRTGNLDSKFGFPVPTGQAHDAVLRARASESVELVGLHPHIGSQVFSVDNFLDGLSAWRRSCVSTAGRAGRRRWTRRRLPGGGAMPRRSPNGEPRSSALPGRGHHRPRRRRAGARCRRGGRGDRSTRSAPSSTSPGCAPMWRSTAG